MHEIRSAGTENSAKIRISQNMINWADKIYVMESKHQKRILDKFIVDNANEKIEVLDIPDIYTYMDSELILILNIKLEDQF